MKVLITGGSGFLGHALVERLLASSCERICIYSRNEFNQARMRRHFNDNPRLRWFIGDVRDEARLARAMQSVECVVHAAALKRIEVGAYNPDEMVKTNVIGTMNVIAAARAAANVGNVLLVSSDKAFEPVSPYGQTKALAESLFLTAAEGGHLRFAVVRYGNVAGSTGSVIPTWREAIARKERIRITDHDCTRFWMTRTEAATLVLNTMGSMKGGELVIPELPAFRLLDLAIAMGKPKDMPVGLGPYEKLHESMARGNSSDLARRMSVDELKEALAHV